MEHMDVSALKINKGAPVAVLNLTISLQNYEFVDIKVGKPVKMPQLFKC